MYVLSVFVGSVCVVYMSVYVSVRIYGCVCRGFVECM